MRLFDRFRRKPAEPDTNFPGLDRARASALRSAIRAAAAERGAAVTIAGRTITLDHPRLGRVEADAMQAINQLMSTVHPKAPQRIAYSLVDQMLASPRGAGSTTANVYASVRPRLVAVQDGEGTFTRDTSVSVVLDTGEGFKTMPEDALALIDDPSTLRHAAEVNLRADLESTYDVHVAQRAGGVQLIEAIGSELATAATDLEHVMELFVPRIDRSAGVLFAVPAHGVIIIAPVTEGTELVETMHAMAKEAVTYPTRQPLSRLIHLWHDGHIETLSTFDEDAKAVVITPNDYLTNLLRTTNGFS